MVTVSFALLLVVATGCGGPDRAVPESAPDVDLVSTTTLAADAEVAGEDAAAADTVGSSAADAETAADDNDQEQANADVVRVGAEVMAADDFALLAGQRVGVILNQASTVGFDPLLDVMARSSNVDLVAVFGPEHGIRGNLPAGVPVADSVDASSGAPVFSLYGATKRPTPESLANLDVLVFDLQDVGARVYTYISTMGLAMQAAAEAGIPFMVLDRPNPLGGTYVDGYLRDDNHESFVGQYPIPLAHGMTTGELALAIKGEAWLPGLESLDLQVVEMTGWSRDQTWLDLDRVWVPPSPSLPDAITASVYPGTVLFEGAAVSVGRGTERPFAQVGAPGFGSTPVVDRLNGLALAGVAFESTLFTPVSTEAVPAPTFAGLNVEGIRVIPQDETFRPVEVGVHLLSAFYADAEQRGVPQFFDNPQLLDLLAGTDELRLALEAGTPAQAIIDGWSADLAAFDELRQPYLLYR